MLLAMAKQALKHAFLLHFQHSRVSPSRSRVAFDFPHPWIRREH